MLLASVFSAESCRDLFGDPEPCFIRVELFSASDCAVKSASSIPDVDDFILAVTDGSGKEVWKGRYADSPEEIQVQPGNYTVSAISREFSSPMYEAPQYGDTKVLAVTAGKTVAVALNCSLQNCGLHIDVDWNFKSMFPDGILYLNSSEGNLMYDYDEDRTAYFLPGAVSVSLRDRGGEQTLFMRNLTARQMLTVGLSATSDVVSTGIRVLVDTTRDYVREEFVFGSGGHGADDAYGVGEALERIGREDVWVKGYIVGSCVSNSRIENQAPFSRNTNIVIAARSSSTDRDSCIAVELRSGDMRNTLNLVDHPELLGRKVCICGDVVASYFSLVGLKNVSGFTLL